MPRHGWAFLSCALLVAIGCGPTKNPSNIPGETFDAGAIFHETTPEVVHTFTMVNPTNRVVKVKEVRRSCTCTEATASRKTIAPGESVELTMKVKSQPIYREWDVAGSLDTNDPDNPLWTCHLKFRTYPQVQFEKTTVDLGDVKTANTIVGGHATWIEMFESAKLKIPRDPVAKPFTLDFPDHLAVVPGLESTVETLDNGAVRRHRYPIRIGLKPGSMHEASAGTHTATITAKTNAGATASIVVAITNRAPLIPSPSILSFGIVRAIGDRSLRKIVLRATDGQPFRLLSVASDSKDISTIMGSDSQANQPNTTHTVEIAFQRGSSAREFLAGHVVILTDHREMPGVQLPWSVISP